MFLVVENVFTLRKNQYDWDDFSVVESDIVFSCRYTRDDGGTGNEPGACTRAF